MNDTNLAQKARIAIDEVVITAPIASDFELVDLRVDPEAPVYTNAVHVLVELKNPFLNPTDIQLFAEYGVASQHGAWTNTVTNAMEIVSADPVNRTWTYRTIDAIPPQPSDHFVKYQILATFNGVNAASVSPKIDRTFDTPTFYYPLEALYGTNTPYYIALSYATNAVWINEVDPGFYDWPNDNYWDFIEIAGHQGIDLTGWKILVFNATTNLQPVYTYTITNNATLTDQTNGYGFYLLGKTSLETLLPPVTPDYLIPEENGIPYPGGVALQRPVGIYSSAIAFGGGTNTVINLTDRGFTYIGADYYDYWGESPYSISMIGTGSTSSAFSWFTPEEYAGTPGSANIPFQELERISNTEENAPPEIVLITGFTVTDTQILFTVTGTNGWLPGLWMTTNLSVPSAWTSIAATVGELSNATYELSIERPTNAPAYFFKVVTTNATP